jgi:transcriptional regulator
VHINDAFRIEGVTAARAIVRAQPFATIVTADLRATHMPCLVDEDGDGLAILSHVARADPVCAALAGPLLMVFQGARGYVSASWYASETIPTWNHVTLHVRGTPERFDDPMPVLRRTVDHFESAAARPWSIDRMDDGEARAMADRVVAFRLRADSWHAEAKLSQDKPADEQARVLAGLEGDGPYANAELAAAMRQAAGAASRSSTSSSSA